METRQLLRPLRSSLSSSAATTTTITTLTRPAFAFPAAAAAGGRRHQSTAQRTKKMLKIPPHPDFLTPTAAAGGGTSHVIYNPPAAAPSVYHTPFKFLPREDPRRQANLTQLLRTSADAAAEAARLPPVATKDDLHEMRYHVTREQVDEMRRLRAEDPAHWTVHRLAGRYGCGHLFVMMCCRAPKDHADREFRRKIAIKERWGHIKTKAREERWRRKQMLLKGEL
ncbi:hypothetical protein F4780DRAFT_453433 [Xylariomycetidae sp. FL0641]|nr:hypothetical protein F4780DRAFT_453433 [Xylariomycetidae sp. FL0641]